MSQKPIKKIIVKNLKHLPPNLRVALSLLKAPKDETLYFSDKPDKIMPGEYQSITIKNTRSFLTKDSTTYAVCKDKDVEVVRNSVEITKIIGQKNYNNLLTALRSLLDRELQIRTILSLLTVPRKYKDASCQTDIATDEETANKVVHSCNNPSHTSQAKCIENGLKRLHVGCNKMVMSVNSPMTDIKDNNEINLLGVTAHGDTTNTDLLNNDLTMDINESYKDHTICNNLVPAQITKSDTEFIRDGYDEYTIETIFNKKIMLPFKPEDMFHWAVPEILKRLLPEERLPLIQTQAYIDWRYCLEVNEDGYMPIHLAAIHSEPSLIQRQCAVLKMKGVTVDVRSRNKYQATALSLCSAAECVRALLRAGARVDAAGLSVLHAAAETRDLDALLDECRRLSSPHSERAAEDSEESQDLLQQARAACHAFNEQGYTPLMLAARKGLDHNTSLLLDLAPCCGLARPNNGDTALHLAVSGAGWHMRDSNLTEVPANYRRTIELLLQRGASVDAANATGARVLDVLSEFASPALTNLVNATVCSVRYNSRAPAILVKKENGDIECVDAPVGAKRRCHGGGRKGNKRAKPIITSDVLLLPVKGRSGM